MKHGVRAPDSKERERIAYVPNLIHINYPSRKPSGSLEQFPLMYYSQCGSFARNFRTDTPSSS